MDNFAALNTVNVQLGQEVDELRTETEDVSRQNDTLNRMNAELKADLKEQRNRAWTAERKHNAAEKRAIVAEARLVKEKEKVRTIQKEKKNKADLLRYHENKKKDARELARVNRELAEVKAEKAALVEKSKKLTTRVGELGATIVEKEEEIEKLLEREGETIMTSKGGVYTPEFRCLIYSLLGYNVPHHHIADVIRDILAIANKRASTLPTDKTIGTMNLERLTLSQKQIGVIV